MFAVSFGFKNNSRISWLSSMILLVALLLLSVPVIVDAETQDLSLILEATSMYIHYEDGYLRGPGAYIDLHKLSFTPFAGSMIPYDELGDTDEFMADDGDFADDAFGEDDDEAFEDDGDDEGFGDDAGFGDDDGGGRKKKRRRRLATNATSTSSFVDIAVFMEPSSCASSEAGCSWPELGFGAQNPDLEDEIVWCCTEEAVSQGLCAGGDELGRLILKPSFAGVSRSIEVPSDGESTLFLSETDGVFKMNKSGRVILAFANCNDEHGRSLIIDGQVVWKSHLGYLPGELFPFMYFYTIVTCLYAALFAWFVALMRKNAATRIPIEGWICATIVIGLVEVSLKTADFLAWNSDGVKDLWITFTSIAFGVLKHAISRTLFALVSLGWGVTTDRLGCAMYVAIAMGIVYLVVAGSSDFAIIFAIEDMQTMSIGEEEKIFEFATLMVLVLAAVNSVFVVFTLLALTCTMCHLRKMNQTLKLSRFIKLTILFVSTTILSSIWSALSILGTFSQDGISQELATMKVNAGHEAFFLLLLAGVAFLWRPSPDSQEYAYVMVLSDNDGAGGLGELELTENAYDDDDGPRKFGSYDGRFKIDDGVSG